MTKPTDEEWRLLVALFKRKAPIGPSFAEIEAEWGNARQTIAKKLKYLRSINWITWNSNRARTYQLLKPLTRECFKCVDGTLVPMGDF